jgi:predicted RND superfamily exporter protein
VEAARLRAELQKAVDRAHLERFDVRATLTGNGIIGYVEMDKIVDQILWGFVTAFAIVIGLELIIFRSMRIAIASIFPNLLPLAACFIAMRIIGLDFRLDSSLVLCVSIGALFNTTIHIIAKIRLELEGGGSDPDEIVERALRSVGPASLFTAVILSVGFSLMLLSSFPGLQALGLLSVITMISAFFSDAVFTTILMRVLYAWPQPVSREVTALEIEGNG